MRLQTGRLEMPSALLWAYSAELDFLFGIQKSLRAFLSPLFTGGVVKANGSCSACFLRKRGAAISILSLSVIAARCHRLRGFARRGRKNKNREASQNFPVDSYILFFITAKDPARGSTPRCGGTSAPRPGPWRPGAARPSPPRGTPPARWGTP